MPAPAVPLPSKKEMPRRSWGWKPPTAVRARLGKLAWNGRAVTLVLELEGGLVTFGGGEIWLGGGKEMLYKPDWVELVVLWTSSKTLESFGICGFGQFFGL